MKDYPGVPDWAWLIPLAISITALVIEIILLV